MSREWLTTKCCIIIMGHRERSVFALFYLFFFYRLRSRFLNYKIAQNQLYTWSRVMWTVITFLNKIFINCAPWRRIVRKCSENLTFLSDRKCTLSNFPQRRSILSNSKTNSFTLGVRATIPIEFQLSPTRPWKPFYCTSDIWNVRCVMFDFTLRIKLFQFCVCCPYWNFCRSSRTYKQDALLMLDGMCGLCALTLMG